MYVLFKGKKDYRDRQAGPGPVMAAPSTEQRGISSTVASASAAAYTELI